MTEPTGQPLDLEQLLSELAVKIERVKQLYEQYFLGIEKIEPLVARKEVQRAMLQLQQQYIRNTGLRFKFNTMLQKWNIYVTYWNRILREIEAGTYVRHLAKVKRAAEREGQTVPEELLRARRDPTPTPAGRALDDDSGARPLPAPVDEKTDPGLERIPARTPPGTRVPPLPPPPPPAAMRPRAATPPSQVAGVSEAELRTLHQKLSDARRSTGEGPVSYDALVQSLSKQVGRVLAQPGVRSVSFDVAVQNGRAVIRATPKK